jgi:ParB family chromosome partitioning protein
VTAKLPTRRISQIRIGKRIRQDHGDLKPMAENFRELGVLQPVVISPNNDLLAGERRLKAAKLAGLNDVPITVSDADPLLVEFSENTFRKAFTPSEMVAAIEKHEKRQREAAKARQTASLKRGGKKPVRGNSPDGGRALDKIGKALGRDRRTLEKARAVVVAARAEPERFGKLLQDMDRTGREWYPQASRCDEAGRRDSRRAATTAGARAISSHHR